MVVRDEIPERDSVAESKLTQLVSKLVAQSGMGFRRTNIQPALTVGDAESHQQALHESVWNRLAHRFGGWDVSRSQMVISRRDCQQVMTENVERFQERCSSFHRGI